MNLSAQVISSSGTVSINNTIGTVIVTNTIENNSGSTLENGGTITTADLTNAGTIQGNGQYNISGAFTNSGTVTPGTSTFDFNGSGSQTIPAVNFYNLTSSSTGARVLANSGTIGIAGLFTEGTNAYTITGSTIDFNGSAQTIPDFNGGTGYNNLTLSNSGPKTSPSGTTTTVVAGNFTIDAGITYEQAGGATSTLTLNGASNTISGELGSVANPFTAINLGNGNADATSITAATGSLNAGTVAIGAFTITVTNNNIARISGNLTGGAAAATWVNAANASLSVGGTLLTTGTLTATANPNTVSYNGTSAGQTVKAATYHHLIVDKTAQTATTAGTTIMNGDLTVTSGTLNITGIAFTVTGTTTVNGSMGFVTSNAGNKSFASIVNNGTITFDVTETAPLTGSLTMGNNSTISGSVTGIMTVAGNLDVTGTSSSIGRLTLTVSGTTNITGDIDFNDVTGLKTMVGLVTITSPGTWASSGNGAFNLRGGLQNDNTFSSGTGTYTLITNSQTLSGSGGLTFDGIVAISGAITVDVTCNTSFNGNVTGTVATTTLRAATGITVNFRGAAVLATGTLDLTTNTPNTVVYSSTTVAQSVKGTTYYNLEINGNDYVKTLAANDTVTNLLTVTAGTLNLSTRNLIMGASSQIILNDSMVVTSATGTRTWNSLTINSGGIFSCTAAETFTLSGDWTNNGGTFSPGTSIITFNGTGPQAINGTAYTQSFFSIIISNSASAVTVGGSTTSLSVGGVFTQTLGDFAAPDTMSITGTATFTVGTFTAGPVLNIGGSWTAATGTVFVDGGGTVTFDGTGAQTIGGTLATKTFHNFVINKTVATTLNTGGGTTTITVNGVLTQTQGNFTPPATLNVAGTGTLTDGTFSIGAGTKTFTGDLNINSTAILTSSNAAAILNIGGNLTMDGTSSITGAATGTINVTGNLNIAGSNILIGRAAINISDTTLVTGNVDFNNVTGTKTFIGPVVIESGATWDATGNPPFVLRGGLAHSGASFGSGTGTYTFNTNNQSINSTSSLTFGGAVTITGAISVTNYTDVTITGALTGSVAGSTWVNETNSILTAGNALLATGTLTASANPNTVEYVSTAAGQTIKTATYHHLVIDKAAQVGTISAATTVNGDLTVTAGTLSIGAAAVAVNGTTNVNGTLTITSGTGTKDFADINLNANSILNFTAIETATLSGNLVMGNSSSITGTVTGIVSVGGTLTISGTGVTIGQSSITVSGTTTITGDVDFSSAVGTKTFGGLITLSGSGAWTTTANSPFTIQGGITHDGASFSSGSGIYTFSINPQTIGGAGLLSFDNMTVTGVTVSNDNSNASGLTVTTSLIGTGGLTNMASRRLNISGTSTITTLTASAAGNSVYYNGGAQTVHGGTYHHLLITTAGIKTAGASITVNGDLSITGGTFDLTSFTADRSAPGGTLTIAALCTLRIGGVGTSLPANYTTHLFDPASRIEYYGTGQTLPAGTYDNLNISGSGTTITLNANIDISGDLIVTDGTLDLATFTANRLSLGGTLSIGSGGSLRIGGTNSIPTNYSTYTFDPAGTVEYYGTSHTITALNYGNLNVSSSGAITLPATTVGISGTFTPGPGTYTTTGNTIDYNGSGAQTVAAFNYNDLTLSNAGTKTFAGGTTAIAGALTVTGATADATTNSSIIEYNGTGAQTVTALTYYDLTFTNGGTKTIFGTVTVNRNVITNAGSVVVIDVSGTMIVHGDLDNSGDFTNHGIFNMVP